MAYRSPRPVHDAPLKGMRNPMSAQPMNMQTAGMAARMTAYWDKQLLEMVVGSSLILPHSSLGFRMMPEL